MAKKSRELTDAPDVKLPGTAARIATAHPKLWERYQKLGEAVAEAGPLSVRERRLVHLAYALGSTSEGAAHSHVRRALSEGIEATAVEHVALLATTPLGWPQAVPALSLVGDVTQVGGETASKGGLRPTNLWSVSLMEEFKKTLCASRVAKIAIFKERS